jgi:hypothetical protein
MPTTLARELKEQERWRPREPFARMDWFARLVHGEFIAP